MAEHARERPETLTHPLSPRWLDRPAAYRDFESAFFVGRGLDTFVRCADELLHWQVKIRSGFDIVAGAAGVAGAPGRAGAPAGAGASAGAGAAGLAGTPGGAGTPGRADTPGGAGESAASEEAAVGTRRSCSVRVAEPPPRVEAGQEPTIFVRLGLFRLPEPARVIDVFEETDRVGFTYETKPGHPITGEESFILTRTPDDRVFLVLRSVSRPGFGIWHLGEPFVRIAQIIFRRRYARALRS